MPLPWVRLDANIATNDKVLALLSDPSAKRFQAFTLYVCALGWSGGQGTDGKIPPVALTFVHGTPATARLLVKHKLWTEATTGYEIVNYSSRQQTAVVTEAKRAAQSEGARKANCVRHHGKTCGCWKATA